MRQTLSVLTLSLLTIVTVSCRKERVVEVSEKTPEAIVAPELLTNQLGNYPGAVFRSQALSPIHWQVWTAETLEKARAARRMVFSVIAMPQHPDFQKVLDALNQDEATVREINNNYVPILIDGDASRDMSILIPDLTVEIDRSPGLLLMLWLSHEGNPVAWIPVNTIDPSSVRNLFKDSHNMVFDLWNEDQNYVLSNSRIDNEIRRERISKRRNIEVMSEQPALDLLRCIRQLTTLYDPINRTFDETGSLFPVNSIELLASASVHPGLPEEIRKRSMDTLRELLVDLLPSAMFDPLDGGVFSARRANSWSLPAFTRDCPTQGRVAVSLFEAYRATGNPRLLEVGLGVISFAEQAYRTKNGLFSVGLNASSDPMLWMWTVEEVRQILGPADAEWWIKSSGMKDSGNLSLDLDPRRLYFRSNTLSMNQSVRELATELSIPMESFAKRFETAKAKLLAAREQRLEKSPRDETAHAPSTFRMVSAYAAAFVASGNESYREKAVALLKLARNSFADGPTLRVFATEAPPTLGAGRAFHYALAMQAILDVAAITSDEQWLVWSEDLATTSAEYFTGDKMLKESSDDTRLMGLPVTDLAMLFDDSTAGLVSMAECRLAVLGRPLVTSFSELATPLPVYAMDRPVMHTDLLLATMARHYQVTVIHAPDTSPELKLAVERLPLRMIQRRAAKAADAVPAGAVKILLGEDAQGRIVTTAEELRAALLP